MPGQPEHPLIEDESALTSEQLSILFNGAELLKLKALGRVTFHRVGYLRISKDRAAAKAVKAGRGLGVLRQYKGICKKAPEPIEFWYVDNDLSAWSGKDRPDYINMCNDVRSGVIDPFGKIWAYFNDRLHRNTIEGIEFMMLCFDHTKKPSHKRDITVHIATSGVQNFHSADGRKAFIEGTVAAEHYSGVVSEKTRDKMDEKVENGEPPNGKRKFGMKTGGLEHEPAEAEAIRRGAEMVLSSLSLSAVAKDWNDRGMRGVLKGGRVNVNTVRLALTRPYVAGLNVHRGEIVGKGNWEPILEPTKWEAVKLALANGKSWQTGGTKVRWLGTSLYKDGVCGEVMYVSGGVYKCKAKRPEREPDGLIHASRVGPPLDAFIEGLLFEKLSGENIAADLAERGDGDTDVDVAALLARRAELDAEIPTYRALIGTPGWGPMEVKDAVGRLTALMTGIDEQLSSLASTSLAAEFVAGGVTEPAWSQTSIESKRALLSELATVTVHRSPRGVHGKNRDSTEFVAIDWHI